MLFMRIKWSFLLKIWSQFNLFQFLIQKMLTELNCNQLIDFKYFFFIFLLLPCSKLQRHHHIRILLVQNFFRDKFCNKLRCHALFRCHFPAFSCSSCNWNTFCANWKKNKGWYDLIEMQEIQCFKTLWNVKNTKCELLPLPERFFLFGEINLLWTTWTNSWHFDALWSKTLSPNNCLNEV